MNELTIDSYAKINLGLDVLSRREDGYHNIRTIMQEIDLKDRLSLRRVDQGFSIDSNNKNIPLDETNLVGKVWLMMKERFKLSGGLAVYIDKKIPVAGGLAGGSTNAAGALRAISQLWGLDLSQEEMEGLALEIGADVPFCLRGGTWLAEGVGNIFSQELDFKDRDILIVNPGIEISSGQAYEGLSLRPGPDRIGPIIQALERGDLEALGASLYNKLEENTLKEYSEIRKIKETMLELGARASLMSGSGSTVFAIFASRQDMEEAGAYFKEAFRDYIVVGTKSR